MARKSIGGSKTVSTGTVRQMTGKPGGAPDVQDAVRPSKVGGQATVVTGRVSKATKRPAIRGRGTY